MRWSASTADGTALAFYEVQERTGAGAWRTLEQATTKTSLTTSGTVGRRYRFRVRPANLAGQLGNWANVTAASAT
ncbi:MAG: fibronectin type III domain-containing protein [Solirubrobacteraceae bacterium]|jgi:hypothetical protein